jgi:hypothetical protein
VEFTPAFGHDPAVYTHPESCSLSDMPDRAVFPRDAYATARIKPCADIRGPKPDDNCIPIACGLDPLQFPWSFPWFVNLSGSRPRRLHHFSGPVKSQESPGRVGGLPTKNYYYSIEKKKIEFIRYFVIYRPSDPGRILGRAYLLFVSTRKPCPCWLAPRRV